MQTTCFLVLVTVWIYIHFHLFSPVPTIFLLICHAERTGHFLLPAISTFFHRAHTIGVYGTRNNHKSAREHVKKCTLETTGRAFSAPLVHTPLTTSSFQLVSSFAKRSMPSSRCVRQRVEPPPGPGVPEVAYKMVSIGRVDRETWTQIERALLVKKKTFGQHAQGDYRSLFLASAIILPP